MSEVVLEHLECRYGNVAAVRDFALEIRSGEFVTLLGPSGSGKTSVLRMVGGYITPRSGKILVDSKDITRLPPQSRNIGMVFQDYALFPHLRVFENVAYGLKARGVPRNQIAARVRESLELVHLGEFERRYPRELSGGQQQRVALARAIVILPSLLLMDEPLGALDLKLRESMQTEIRRVQKATGITTIYVTHDQGEAFSMSDRIVVMQNGQIVSMGTAEELFERPGNRFTAEFIGNATILPVEMVAWNGVLGTVRVPGHKADLTLKGECPDDNRQLYIALRPDKAVCSKNAAAGSLEGRVVGRRFSPLGTFLEIDIGGLRVGALDRRKEFEEGQQVSVYWAPEDINLLQDAESS